MHALVLGYVLSFSVSNVQLAIFFFFKFFLLSSSDGTFNFLVGKGCIIYQGERDCGSASAEAFRFTLHNLKTCMVLSC